MHFLALPSSPPTNFTMRGCLPECDQQFLMAAFLLNSISPSPLIVASRKAHNPLQH